MGAAQLGSGQAIYNLVDSLSQTGPRDAAMRRCGAASAQQHWVALSMQLCFVRPSPWCSFDRTALGCSVDATLLRPAKSVVQPRPNGTGSLCRCSFALSSRGGCAASVERHRVALSMQLCFVRPSPWCSFSRTAPGRSVDAALLCLVEAASIASLSML